jgi:N-methylhydantoinase B
MGNVGTEIDIFTAEIIRSGLTSAALEMNKTISRTAYNPLLYEVQDFGVGILSSHGLLWGEAPGMTFFISALAETIKTGIAKHGHDGFAEGDVLIVNDPYLSGTHLPDVTIYVPVFFRGELIAFAASTAHWADVGGKSPGGWSPDSTDVYQEGVCFGHQKLIASGTPADDLFELIESNVRFPTIVRGDLDAQIAACRVGAARTQALCVKYGPEKVKAAMSLTIARTDEAVRRQISEFPDGTYSASVQLDFDGVVRGEYPLIRVVVEVAGDRIRVSFEGSSPARHGPINTTAVGARSAARVALKALLMPLDRTNEGHFLAMDFDLPGGLIVSAKRPSPCDSYGYVMNAVVELIFRALAQAIPERTPAGGYQLFGVFFSRVHGNEGGPFIAVDPVDGGGGASANADGPTLFVFSNGDLLNTPVEVLETRYPIRCERFELRGGVAGPGTYRGGLGVIRDYRILEAGIYMQTVNENVLDPLGRGVAGGGDGAPSTIVVLPATEKETELRERATSYGPFEPSELVSFRSGGGGGWGPPWMRDPEQVTRDVRDELLTPEDAASTYQVVVTSIDRAWKLDRAETERLRAKSVRHPSPNGS